MIFKIKGQDVELKFGIGFLRRLDEKHQAEIKDSGVKFGAGLIMANLGISQYNPTILSDVIFCATRGYKQSDVDNALDDYADENGDLEHLFDEIKDEMGKSPVLKRALKTHEKKEDPETNQ